MSPFLPICNGHCCIWGKDSFRSNLRAIVFWQSMDSFKKRKQLCIFLKERIKTTSKRKKNFIFLWGQLQKGEKYFMFLEGQLQGDNFLYFREDQLKEAIFHVFLQGQL